MAHPQHTLSLHLEEALTVLLCLIDDAYTTLTTREEPTALRNPQPPLGFGGHRYIVLFQQLRGVESERSFLRDCESGSSRTCSQEWWDSILPHSFLIQPARVKKLRRYLEALRREILPELVGEPERPCLWTRRCWKSSIRARFLSRRVGEALRREPRGRGGPPSVSTG
jgi:hypothetical protein